MLAVALTVPGGASMPSEAQAATRCGAFGVAGLQTMVRVKVVRGNVPCRNAKRVMKRLFKGKGTGKWDCVGPQTGFASCTRKRSKIKARF